MLNTYQSIYVRLYRWIFKNFGLGKLPQAKSLFNVSFLLIISLTLILLLTEIVLQLHLITVNAGMAMLMLLGTASFMLINYLILLNNTWFKNLNERIMLFSRHNKDAWSVILLVNAIMVCVLSLCLAGN